ncbi:MAG TPA: glycerol-3-phosphate 1-O-acyltransferase [Candidatus Hydrogenedentes bacterium]|nr:glycerol-3-phosphate 1-O-acyltransferase [Candidatus Hydrogenedentota bacterium]
MMEYAGIVAALLLSYLLGSVPTGLWVGLRMRHIDIREHGSRNIGATNTMRVLGKRLGAVALAGDMAKGLLPVLLSPIFSPWPHLPLACGLAAIIGHSFSVFLKFRGGKGVATSTGVFLALAPIPTFVAAVVFGAVLAATRMVSAGSIAAALAMSVAVFCVPLSTPIRVMTLLVAALVVFKHRSNIARILRGEENRI